VSWLSTLLNVLRTLADSLLGNPGQVAAQENLAACKRELDRERKITAALRLRIVEKEARIRELEKTLAGRDPGALLDSVFAGPAGSTKT
jgi:hypothetical protein